MYYSPRATAFALVTLILKFVIAKHRKVSGLWKVKKERVPPLSRTCTGEFQISCPLITAFLQVWVDCPMWICWTQAQPRRLERLRSVFWRFWVVQQHVRVKFVVRCVDFSVQTCEKCYHKLQCLEYFKGVWCVLNIVITHYWILCGLKEENLLSGF